MANKKVSAQSGEGPVEAAVPAAGAKNAPIVVEYTIEELTAGAKTVFPGISPRLCDRSPAAGRCHQDHQGEGEGDR